MAAEYVRGYQQGDSLKRVPVHLPDGFPVETPPSGSKRLKNALPTRCLRWRAESSERARFLHGLTFSCNDAAPTAGTIDVYDGVSASGNKIFSWTLGTTAFIPFTLFSTWRFLSALHCDHHHGRRERLRVVSIERAGMPYVLRAPTLITDFSATTGMTLTQGTGSVALDTDATKRTVGSACSKSRSLRRRLPRWWI